MINDLEIHFWDSVVDGVWCNHHRPLVVFYKRYCCRLSSSHVVISSNRMVFVGYFNFGLIVRMPQYYLSAYVAHVHTFQHIYKIIVVQFKATSWPSRDVMGGNKIHSDVSPQNIVRPICNSILTAVNMSTRGMPATQSTIVWCPQNQNWSIPHCLGLVPKNIATTKLLQTLRSVCSVFLESFANFVLV